jgi:hypothetical protein
MVVEPDPSLADAYAAAYGRWRETLLKTIADGGRAIGETG